jgi:hypothetical protein
MLQGTEGSGAVGYLRVTCAQNIENNHHPTKVYGIFIIIFK